MTWLDFHRQSEQHASFADVCKQGQDETSARHYYGLAAEREQEALNAFVGLEDSAVKPRTIGILAVSVAALYLKAHQFDKLREFVDMAFAELPLAGARHQLQEILGKAQADAAA